MWPEADQEQFHAHVKQDDKGVWRSHPLQAHLAKVAGLSAQKAAKFAAGDWAHAAGIWHDLGKYRLAFQNHISSGSGYKPDAHLETTGALTEHAIVGAIHAEKTLPGYGRILAYLIAGHHAGLPDWFNSDAINASLEYRLRERQALWEELESITIPSKILKQSAPASQPPAGIDLTLWIRMLFSTLVDADFLDTESFMSPAKTAQRQAWPALPALLSLFDEHMATLAATANQRETVNQKRAEVLADCRLAAAKAPGLFTLTVPTGGGKTLASIAFALQHALKHQRSRIIYVIPYTSIIEQTAEVFRKVFGKDAVLEHHSNIVEDSDKQTAQSRLAAENWDAPIIVTTAVQFFESFFAARPGRCRKLHNVVDAVVIFDEAQLLPIDFMKPVLRLIHQLSEYFGVTSVLCTATQPALTVQPPGQADFPALPPEQVREIVRDPAALYESLERVRVELPEDFNQRVSWQGLAAELSSCERVLSIVDRRADAAELFKLLPEKGRYHLSTFMCGEHRSQVIAEIKHKLKETDEPVRVVSTQLIEAGVDVDFPVVYRAMAGLDSIAQAAGRCNREGLLEQGLMKVFMPPKPPPSSLAPSVQAAEDLLRKQPAKPLALEHFPNYFADYYWRKGTELDKQNINELLKPSGKFKYSFRTAAQKFRLIDDSWQLPVIVQWGDDSKALIEQLKALGPERWLLRKLQRYVVNVPEKMHEQLQRNADIEELDSGIFVQANDFLYNKALGVIAPEHFGGATV